MFSKKIRIGINGFGRIGRNAFKVAFEKKNIEVAAVNDLTDAATLAHLLKHDTNYGAYEKKVEARQGELIVDGKQVKVFAEKDPSKLPWATLKVDVVLECTGKFTTQEGAGAHLKAGAKKVIISALAKASKGGSTKDAGVPTYVVGVNVHKYKGEKIINNASCTTNCIAPVAFVVNQSFGIKKAMMSTVHAYTADQNLQDGPHKDLRRARSAAVSIVPTTSGGAVATSEAIPELKGKFDGNAYRVPVSVVSLLDFVFLLKKRVTVQEVNKVFRRAALSGRLKGVLAVTEEPLVSADFIKNPNSAIVDLGLTKVVDNDLLKVVAWYDNEWGYANRLVELAVEIWKK